MGNGKMRVAVALVICLVVWTPFVVCSTEGRSETCQVALDKDWLEVEFSCNGWDEKTGLRVVIDRKDEFAVENWIGGAGPLRPWAFDVSSFKGKSARVVATCVGSWEGYRLGGIKTCENPGEKAFRLQPRSACRPLDMSLPRRNDERFLNVPICKSAPTVTCRIADGEKSCFDLRLKVAVDGEGDMMASIPLDGFVADRVRIVAAVPTVPTNCWRMLESRVSVSAVEIGDSKPGRPKVHFTVPYGGSGDMIGFFRLGETYHIGFLHDYGFDIWNDNCSWGHAKGRTLFDWKLEARPYDRKGLGTKRSSGCAFVDVDNRSGLGTGEVPPVLLFGCVEDALCQRYQKMRGEAGPVGCPETLPKLGLRYSTDGGKTFLDYPRPLMILQAHGGHDPEVVYDPGSGRFVMVVHDRRNEKWGFDFYSSADLLSWRYESTVPDMWETPNFYPLQFDGRRLWVLQQCLMDYLVGSFDGHVFSPIGPVNASFKGGFAPRTFLTPDGRRVLMAALVESNFSGEGKGYCGNGGASLPMEVSLVKTPEGPRLAYAPVRELQSKVGSFEELVFEVPEGRPYRRTLFAGVAFICDEQGRWSIGRRSGKFFPGEKRVVRIIWDRPVLDYFIGSGVACGTMTCMGAN